MGTAIGLEIGAQAGAADIVADCADAVITILQDLADVIEAQSPRVTGGGAGTFYQAISDWFEVASLLPGDLGAYAQALVAVDTGFAQTESRIEGQISSTIAQLLGGSDE